MPHTSDPKKRAMALKIDRPKTTDDWQEAQDASGEPESQQDRLGAMAGDEPPRILSKRLTEAEKAVDEEQ